MRKGSAVAIVLACMGLASAAEAEPYIPGLYSVINYSGAFPDYRKLPTISFPSNLDGVEADLGWRFNRFYSMEASYSYFTGQKNASGESLTTTLQTVSLDALGYLPFGFSSPWALYGDVGGTYYILSANTAFVKFSTETKFGGRAGGGLQYMINEDLGVRAGARYEWADLSHMKSAEVFAVGLVWQR